MSLTRFVFASDLHGDQSEVSATDALAKFIEAFKPKLRIFGGDLWDFRPLRRKACEDEKRESMEEDYQAGLRWIKGYRPNYFLLGNHDARLWELAERDNGVLSDYAVKGVAEIEAEMAKMRCRILPYHNRDGVLRIGHLKMLHGFHAGVNAARQTALVYGSALFGHVHTIDEHSIPGLERRVARSVGCLCKLSMEYNVRTPSALRHSHGFAYGVINEKTGNYNVFQAEEIDGHWLFPTGFFEV